ncbi:sugar phosphate isomerase/epimerase family protein [Lignipirellula cremea]|uniref:Inosose isomerase n=1 Tax=Lignipirellula cremea TaxID=2528010 RepID=A0A518DXD1_9BACT|nr:sugar phosphate isomerase/epimerase family protein [Lignipirellula cremea]QDU96495.1 Inosose isomerase [Lignipirellula cremea]
MSSLPNRRQLMAAGLASSVSLGALAATTASACAAPAPGAAPRFKYCLNTSTIRGQKLSLLEEVELAAVAGYDAIEPWVREIQAYQDQGGKLPELKRRIADAGLTVESAIGFANWIVDDDEQRAAGLETARREMDLVKAIGGTRIAAPPVGATKEPGIDLFAAAERYGKLIEVGVAQGVIPQVEVWGFSANLSRLGETSFVAIESGRTEACILPDVYHIYKGGSDFAGLSVLAGNAIHVFHMNDYPADPPRATIGDADRVYPGDGVAPLTQILQMLAANGFNGALSLELFNRDYWTQDPKKVAATGLAKMKASVAKAFA